MTQRVFITGAASGIGLALVQQYLEQGWEVIAAVRATTAAIEATGAEIISGLDVSQDAVMALVKERVAGRKLDVLINCAGLLQHESLAELSFEQIEQQWQVNSLGPLRITHALLDNLFEGSVVAMISSRMGSMGDNTSGGYYGYRMSKAALNAAAKSLAEDLKPLGIAVAILHPGLVATKMIGGQGDVSADEAARQLRQRIAGTTLGSSGVFYHANGTVLPW